MEALFVISFFLLGTIVASFIGVVADRLNTGQSFFTGRSYCDICGAPLSPLMLVPIASYLFTRGRATCCGARISSRAPLTELVLGALFAGAYIKLGIMPALPLFLISLSLLLAVVLYDLAHQILPPPLLLPFVASAAITGYVLAPSPQVLQASLVVAVLISLTLGLIHAISRGRAMGLADAPLSFGLSLLVGPAAFPGFVFSFWVGAVVGIVLLFMRPAGSRMGVEVPFAPFLAAGFLLAYFTQWNPFIFVEVLL